VQRFERDSGEEGGKAKYLEFSASSSGRMHLHMERRLAGHEVLVSVFQIGSQAQGAWSKGTVLLQ
jgi:hypothetical protein